MKRVVVDPISVLKVIYGLEIKVDEASGKVEDALSSGTAWRGIELVAKDRDPRDLWALYNGFVVYVLQHMRWQHYVR